MKKNIREVKELLNKERSGLTNHLLNDDNQELEKSLEKIRIAEKIISLNSLKFNRFLSAIILLLVLVTISFLYVAKIPTSNVLLNTINSGFSVHLRNHWKSDDILKCTKIEIDDIKTLTIFPGFEQYGNVSNFSLNSDDILLSEIEFSDAGWVDFDINGKRGLMVIVDTGFVKCTFKIKNGNYSVNNENYSVEKDDKFGFPSSFVVISDTIKKSSDPFIMRFLGVSALNFNITDFDSIRFIKQDFISQGYFHSSIISGDLLFTETNQVKELNNLQKILLVNKSANYFKSTLEGLNLKSEYSGSSKKITSLTSKHKEKLKPSLLEYLYYNKPVAILWSAVIFLISILWSLKKTLIR